MIEGMVKKWVDRKMKVEIRNDDKVDKNIVII